MPDAPFTPKLISAFREGYTASHLRQDALAGLTVAIVALPLSMAIAIGAGVGPERGLYTAIVGGFLISLLGGSRFQIGGPAAAFIGLIAVIVERHGFDGLMLATILAGMMMIIIGVLRLGTYIHYIPHPVTVGFTAGIAVIIIVTQIRDLLGLTLPVDPAHTLPKIVALWGALGTINIITLVLSALAIGTIVLLRAWRPSWPALLIVVVLAAAATALFHLGVETIGTRFGAIPSGLPSPSFPTLSWEKLRAVSPDAVSITLLGSIESLLSAVVADKMTGRRHRSNVELVAQGIGNIASAVCGGLPVTGTLARTATNIRAGAHSPISGMFHALYLWLFVMFAMSLVAFVPLAALGAVLFVVAWRMFEAHEIRTMFTTSPIDALIWAVTFALTITVGLLPGIGAGIAIAVGMYLWRGRRSRDTA